MTEANSTDGTDIQTLSVTVTGDDRPGVTGTLLGALSGVDAEVLDIQQVVVHGHLTLTVLLRPGAHVDQLRDAAAIAAHRLGLALTVVEGTGVNARSRQGRAAVVVLGAPLSADAVSLVTTCIADHGANIDRIRRLSRYPVTTVEFDISGADLASLRTELALVATSEGIDIAVAPGGLARRGRRLVVLDVDSTLIQQEVIELLAAHSGREAEVAEVTARAMAGELDFEESLRARVATLAGLPESVLDEVRESVQLTPGARTLVRTLKRLGFTVGLVSGGFIEIVGELADDLGIDHARANRLEIEDGHLTGRVVGEVVDRAGKARALREFAEQEGLPLSRTVAIGDGANDLDMLDVAGLGVAFNAKPIVQEQAQTAVNVPYLDSVLYLLGISREEIEEADLDDGTPTQAPPVPHAGH
ncbi:MULTISPECIES: phosphoserine phosphatase SerB [unclassified Terrabacter]|uniref:phosphoserine phosphatase SerB n=1 Tax=unclassified Terrabacter TaxID=2630222 RepID=UPI0006FF0310|nr:MULTISPECIES: phosphoserine phosphatase SerB [unclassified Terrabacter]KRB45525.1 phosphoserine phosphatase [Terrabacter sp. Root181]KRF41376.1 phosphoserine phosphatase [Terrabacter sp. Soil810]